MKNKRILLAIFIVLLGSCSTPQYLPKVEEIDVNQYGSFIRIELKQGGYIEGEFIAVDSNKLCVLYEREQNDSVMPKICVFIPISAVESFTLQYAQTPHYGWTIPVLGLLTASSGINAVFTAPITLIVTVSVTVSGEKSFKYSEDEMTFEKLKMFARFPQGIPPSILLESIK